MPDRGPDDRANPTRIIDAHHHIWRQADVPWLAAEPRPRIFGPYDAIRRDYDVAEFAADVGAWPVQQSVYVQCNWDPTRAVDESAWVQSVADSCERGFPHGIVAYVDLMRDDVASALDAHLRHRNVVGVRQQLHWHNNPDWAYVGVPDVFDNRQWRRGFEVVVERGLPFDLQIFPSQMMAAARFAETYPAANLVLNHGGMLEERSDRAIALWSDGMHALAEGPNVRVKLSGLNTFVHSCNADLMKPIVQTCLEYFGSQRCLFGSNFPIEKLWTTYDGYISALIASLDCADPAITDDVFYRTAAAVYGL